MIEFIHDTIHKQNINFDQKINKLTRTVINKLFSSSFLIIYLRIHENTQNPSTS